MRHYWDAQAGFWLNSKFWSKFSRKPLSGIEDQKAPPLPPILEIFRFGITKVYSGIPSPPISENFRFRMTKVYSGIPPPILETSDLGWPKFTPEYPPTPPDSPSPRVSEYRELLHVETFFEITTSFY